MHLKRVEPVHVQHNQWLRVQPTGKKQCEVFTLIKWMEDLSCRSVNKSCPHALVPSGAVQSCTLSVCVLLTSMPDNDATYE